MDRSNSFSTPLHKLESLTKRSLIRSGEIKPIFQDLKLEIERLEKLATSPQVDDSKVRQLEAQIAYLNQKLQEKPTEDLAKIQALEKELKEKQELLAFFQKQYPHAQA